MLHSEEIAKSVDAIVTSIVNEHNITHTLSGLRYDDSKLNVVKEQLYTAKKDRQRICQVEGVKLLTNFLENLSTLAVAAYTIADIMQAQEARHKEFIASSGEIVMGQFDNTVSSEAIAEAVARKIKEDRESSDRNKHPVAIVPASGVTS